MSGGINIKPLPKEKKQVSPQAMDMFEEQKDNMPCKECKKGSKDCECPKPSKVQKKSTMVDEPVNPYSMIKET